jgi:DNA gyrase subunit A
MTVVNPDDELLVISAQGMGKRTPIGSADPTPVSTNDSPADDDNSDSDIDIEENEASETLENGDAETSAPEESSSRRYRRTRRGAKGVISMKLREGDSVVAALQVPANSNQELILISVEGQTVRLRVQDVRLTGRAAYGVIVMRLSEDDRVATATIVDELSEEEIAANQAKEEENADMAALEAEFLANIQAQSEENTEADDDNTPEEETN